MADWLSAAGGIAVFLFVLAGTWQRWMHPFIDHGREVHLPLRLLQGERLYTDITYHYGPAAPHVNALLYAVFGTSLSTLHAGGIACAALILAMFHWLARRIFDPLEAFLVTGLITVTSALAVHLGNYVQPYAFAALYGWTCAVAALVCSVQYWTRPSGKWLAGAGACAGLALANKPELLVLAATPALMAWSLHGMADRKWAWRSLLAWGSTTTAIATAVYVPVVLAAPWDVLVGAQYQAFTQPGMVHFARLLNGTLDFPASLWAVAAALGATLLLCGFAAGVGDIAVQLKGGARMGRRALWVAVAGAILVYVANATGPAGETHPLRSAPVVLSALLVGLMIRAGRFRQSSNGLAREQGAVLLVVAFGLVAIVRVVFNVSLLTAYTPFTVPPLILVYMYVLLRVAPRWLSGSPRAGEHARRVGVGLVALLLAGLVLASVTFSRSRNTFAIQTARGRLLTTEALGRPLVDAVRLVQAETEPGDYVLSVPQGTLVNFLADRPTPMHEENIVPGNLTPAREADLIRRLDQLNVRLVLIANVLTPDYAGGGFGVGYNDRLVSWIRENYATTAILGPVNEQQPAFGEPGFFIEVLRR